LSKGTIMKNRRRLFAASCAALVANAMAFSICTDVMGDFERVFQLTKVEAGQAVSWGAIGGTIVLFAGGALLDFVGVGTVFWLALATHLAGFTTVIFAQDFWGLAIGWLFLALAGGLVQAAINPLAATLYPEKKTQIFNMLHAWWPGGLVIGGVLAYGLGWAFDLPGIPEGLRKHGWQIKMACAYVPVALYAALILGQTFPKTERVEAGVKTRAMFREALRPMFLLLMFCMLLTASVELGPNRWVGVFVKDIVGIRGVLMLAYTSGLMFVLRIFAGPLVRRISSMGLLLCSSVLSALGLLWLSHATGPITLFLAATAFGVGVCYFWPTMLGTTAERFPKGGAFLLAIMGAAGGLFLAYVTVPGMGRLHDYYTLNSLPADVAQKVVVDGRVDESREATLTGDEKKAVGQARQTAASTTFRYVSGMAVVLVIVFGAMMLRDQRNKRKDVGSLEARDGP
jgi:MFS family permease